MNRKVYLTIPLNLVILVDDQIEISEVVSDLKIKVGLSGKSARQADIEDFILGRYMVTDSK